MSTKNKKKIDYKQLRLSDNYQYSSEEEQEKQEEKQEKQDRKLPDPNEVVEWMINKEDTHVNNEIFEKYFKIQRPSLMYKVLRRRNDKDDKNNKL